MHTVIRRGFENAAARSAPSVTSRSTATFDNIYLKVMPRKTINFPIAKSDTTGGANFVFGSPADGPDVDAAPSRPTFGWAPRLRFVAVRLLKAPVFPFRLPAHGQRPRQRRRRRPPHRRCCRCRRTTPALVVMVLLKV